MEPRRPTPHVLARRRPGAIALVAMVLCAGAVAAHEEGVLRLGAPTAAPGQEIEIRGERLPRATSLRLELRGALAVHALGEFATDARGTFVLRLPVPAEAEPGRFRVVAIAPDGDEVARVDLIVVAETHAELTPAGPGQPAQPAHATAEEMELDADLSGGEWAAIGVFVLLCAAGGAALLRPSGRPSS